jgi:hypothetical protein
VTVIKLFVCVPFLLLSYWYVSDKVLLLFASSYEGCVDTGINTLLFQISNMSTADNDDDNGDNNDDDDDGDDDDDDDDAADDDDDDDDDGDDDEHVDGNDNDEDDAFQTTAYRS